MHIHRYSDGIVPTCCWQGLVQFDFGMPLAAKNRYHHCSGLRASLNTASLNTMRMLIAILAASLMFVFVEPSLGVNDAAAANFCKNRYNFCVARCQRKARPCLNRCQYSYHSCTTPYVYLGDVLF